MDAVPDTTDSPLPADAPQADDLSALAWVHGELRRSLEAAHKSLRRYLKEADAIGRSDVDSVDPAVLRGARAQLHQGVGALELVGLPAAAQVLRASEAAVQRMVAKPALADAAAVDAIERSSFALLDFLGRLLAGKPLSPIALFPQYRAAQQLAGADRIHPADLWAHDWQWHALPRDPAAKARVADDAARTEMEFLVLALMRQPDRATVERMSDLCAGLAAGVAPGAAPAAEQAADQATHLATLWQLAAAFFEAQAGGLLASDVYSKRVASRLLAQLRMSVRGQADLSDRLAHDLLFFCAHARPPSAAMPAPRLAAVRRAWQLDDSATADYETPRLGRFDPAWIAQAKKRIAGAKDVWSAVAGGELHRLSSLAEQFALVGDSLQRLFPSGDRLAQALQAAAAQTVASGDAPPPALAMEVATSVLCLDASIEDGELDHPELAGRVKRLAQRIDDVRVGAEAETLEPWMEELYRRVSDRQTMGSVVQELRASLSEVEKQIDQYFRDPSRREVLISVPGQLSAMRGVLSVLGLEQASAAVLHMRADVDALAETEVDPQRAVQTGTFDRLADNLGALSFLIDMLSVQPQLAKSLFRYDPETGNLSAVMGRSERPSAFAAFDETPAAPPSPPPLIEQAKSLADAAAQEDVSDTEFGRQLERLSQQAVAADQSSLARMMGSAQTALRQAGDDDTRQAVRNELAEAMARFAPMPSAPEPVAASAPVPPPRPAPAGGNGLEDDPEMREIFIEEAREVVAAGHVSLRHLADQPEDVAEMTALRRAFHTLKGSSRMVGLGDFGDAAWACEQLFNARIAKEARLDPALHAFTSEALAYLGGWAEAIAAGIDEGHRSPAVTSAADTLRLHDRRVAVPAPGLHAGTTAAAADAAAAAAAAVAADEAVVEAPLSGFVAAPTAAAERVIPAEIAAEVAAKVAAKVPSGVPTAPEVSAISASQALFARVPDLPSAADLDFALPLPDGPAAPADAPIEAQALPELDLGGNWTDTMALPVLMPAAELQQAEPGLDFELDLDAFDDAAPGGLPAATDSGATFDLELPAEEAALSADDLLPPIPQPSPEVIELDFGDFGDFGNLADAFDEPASALAAEAASPPAAGMPAGAIEPAADGETDLLLPDLLLDLGLPARAEADADIDIDIDRDIDSDSDSDSAIIDFALALEPGSATDPEPEPEPDLDLELDLAPGSAEAPSPQPAFEWAAGVEPIDLADHAAVAGDLNTDAPSAFNAEPPARADVEAGTAAAESALDDAVADASFVEAAGEAPSDAVTAEFAADDAAVEVAAFDDDEQVKVIGPLRIGIPLFNIYLNEADELSRRLGTELAEWGIEHRHRTVPESAVALAHSLAGSSATVGYAELSMLARALEHALMRSQLAGNGRPGEAELFNEVADEIRRLLHQFAAGFLPPAASDLMERLAEHERLPVGVSSESSDDDAVAGSPEQIEALADVLPEALADAPTDGLTDGGRLPSGVPASIDRPAAERPSEADVDPTFEPAFEAAPVIAAASFSALAEMAIEPARTVLASADAFDDEDDIDAVDSIDSELFPIFEEEALELLPQLLSRLRDWAAQPADLTAAAACMRTLHTFKGGARLAGAMRLGEMAHRLETAIEHRVAQPNVDLADIEPLLGRVDTMSTAFDALCRPAPLPAVAPAVASPRPLALAAQGEPAADAAIAMAIAVATTVVTTATALAAAQKAGEDAAALSSRAVPPSRAPGPPAAPIDWARFPSGEAPAAALPERPAAAGAAVRVRAALLDRLVNQAGEVSIARARIDADVRQMQGALGDLTDSLERMRRQLRDIELQADTQISSRLEAAKASAAAFDPLEMDRYTRFQELTRFMAESVNDVATLQRSLQRTLQSTEDELAAQARLTRNLQDDLLRTRMVEFESMADRLYRTVRQATKDTGKPVRLDIVGGAIEVDRGVLDRMTGPFEHLLRNSVAHGIEMPDARAAAGKDRSGSITITVSHAGNEVGVEVRDDGAGLDLERIRARGIERGLLAADATPNDAELANLIFRPGFSTAEAVTELSGRGVGLDVVLAEVNAMGGRIETASTPGQGSSFRLLLPLTTAVTQVVMLRCGEFSVAVPSTLVEVVRRVPVAEIEASYASGSYTLGDQVLPFFWLPALLQTGTRGAANGRTQPVVVVRSALQRIALHVDEVLGNQEVVVKNLGPQLSRMPGLAGVTLLPSGAVTLIYNPVALATLYSDVARQRMRTLPAADSPADVPVAEAQAPLVLVVDDSLTVRKVTQRLLLREGYRVTLAKDGMDALERLAEERPTVMLSDIEMPRMDGFDLLRNVRADARLARLPVIMISSRIAQKHRDHAAQLGVDHYLGKPFSEEELLSLVARYAGADIPT